MARFHTTITERGGFRSCRRQWYLDNVERLGHKSQVAWALIFGECIHSAQEAYYKDFKRNLTSAIRAFRKAWAKEDATLQATYKGLYSPSIEDEWLAYKEKGETMLRYYDIYDKQSKFWEGTKILAVNIEQRAFIDILGLDGEHLPDLPLLSGRIDLVLERENGIWIMDHKTAASAYDARALDVDDQLTGYAYIYYRLTGEPIRGCVYNALIKEPPHPPKILTDGSVSKDKAQRTTYDLYLQAMDEQGIDLADPAYEDILAVLQKKGWSQFFLRDEVNKTLEELASFEERLFYEVEDMQRALAEPARLYPNPSQRTCPGCSMIPICQAMEEGGDVDYIKETMYAVKDPRHEIPKTVLSPTWKGV